MAQPDIHIDIHEDDDHDDAAIRRRLDAIVERIIRSEHENKKQFKLIHAALEAILKVIGITPVPVVKSLNIRAGTPT